MKSARREQALRRLQRKYWLALNLYTDVSEAICGLLLTCKCEGLSRKDRARLASLRRTEAAAEAAYLKARDELLAALTQQIRPADRGECTAKRAPV